jgi:DeoR/GlpR family transcriptional regulator of sugar metabolism
MGASDDASATTIHHKERSSEERRRLIGEAVAAQGSVTLQKLTDEFAVSIVTIHRDLAELEKRGVVRRFRGGASAQPSGIFESQMTYRMSSQLNEKKALANAALKYVEPGSSIVLDDSTTVFQMIEGLPERTPLQVATSFVRGLTRLTELAAHNDISVIGLGGAYNVTHEGFMGAQTIRQVRGIHVDAAFLSCRAVSADGVYQPTEESATLKREFMDIASRRYLLVDHTKLNRMALLEISSLNEFDLIITDSKADPAVLKAWKTAGINYEIAS